MSKSKYINYSNEPPKESQAWKCYKKYFDGFLTKSNIVNVMKQCRDFYEGHQYGDNTDPSLPKPVMNICSEYVEKVKAKLTDTDYSVEFTCEDDQQSLRLLDQFYEYQTQKMGDIDFNASVVERALIDGVGCAFTMYDADTYGLKGLYRGFLKRQIVNFEDVFFANPYCEDPQDQKYLGFVQRISVEEARNLCEVKENKEFIVPDEFDFHTEYSEEDIGFDTCTLVTRYYRDKNGEVCFEQSTRYVDLFKKPHHLRPDIDDTSKDLDEDTQEYEDISNEKITIQTKAEKETDSDYKKKLKVFYRYPFSWFRPYPLRNSVLGRSMLTQIMTNQKQVNFMMMMAMLDYQNHGMAKWIVQEDALVDGEVITNDPGQVIKIKNKFGQAVGSAIQRIEPTSASSEQLNQPNILMTLTRQIYGFDNLTASNNLNDTSGYALQQVQKQQDLVLEIPQQRYWLYIRNNAETDLLFFRDYVDEAKFFQRRSTGEISLQNSYKQMAENIYGAYGEQAPGSDPSTGELPQPKEMINQTIKHEDFMKDFEIAVSVTQGIAHNQITESQHINQLFQYIMTGNVDASLIKALINADPSISRKVRSNFIDELNAYENSQLRVKQSEIDQLKQYIKQLQAQFTNINQQVNYQNERLSAYKKATEENAQQNKAIMDAYTNEIKNSTKSEGEVKSNNAKGIEGETFDDTDTEDYSLYE